MATQNNWGVACKEPRTPFLILGRALLKLSELDRAVYGLHIRGGVFFFSFNGYPYN